MMTSEPFNRPLVFPTVDTDGREWPECGFCGNYVEHPCENKWAAADCLTEGGNWPAKLAEHGQPTAYPDDNPKTVVGITKPSLSVIPAPALLHLGRAMQNGAKKYGPYNWREKRVTASIYVDALQRHLLAWWDSREENAADSGVHHLGHALACLAIVLDAQATGNLNDDRPPAGPYASLVAEFTNAAA